MIEDREFGRLEARVDRLEGLRQRLLDMLPLIAVLTLLAGQWLFLFGAFQDLNDRLTARFDVLDERLDRFEASQVRIEQTLARIAPPSQQP